MANVNMDIYLPKPLGVSTKEEGDLIDEGDRRKSPTRLQEAEVVGRNPELAGQLLLGQLARFSEL